MIYHEIHNDGEIAVKGSEVRVWAKQHPKNHLLIKSEVIPNELKNNFET